MLYYTMRNVKARLHEDHTSSSYKDLSSMMMLASSFVRPISGAFARLLNVVQASHPAPSKLEHRASVSVRRS